MVWLGSQRYCIYECPLSVSCLRFSRPNILEDSDQNPCFSVLAYFDKTRVFIGKSESIGC